MNRKHKGKYWKLQLSGAEAVRKGSKNKKTLELEAQQQALDITQTKRGRGRPKGSKNKKTLEKELALSAVIEATNPI